MVVLIYTRWTYRYVRWYLPSMRWIVLCCGILIIFCSLFFYNAAHRLVNSFSGVLFMFDVFFLFISAVGFSLYVIVLSLDSIRIALYCVIE
jgi:hypothetical protein